MKNIKLLEKHIKGKGEVSIYSFTQIDINDFCYIYDVGTHYEVFERKNVAICIDFKNRIYSKNDFKEIYPKSRDFGIWAFTFKSLKEAIEKFNELTIKLKNK